MNPDNSVRQLRHEVALVLPSDTSTSRATEHTVKNEAETPSGTGKARVILAPALYKRCGGEPGHPLAQRVEKVSQDGRLQCVVCGARLIKKFGRQKAWHFASAAGYGACDHEPESVAHRTAKLALRDALHQSLLRQWEVKEDVRLENGRRPDVLATNTLNGARVAFEVQYADLAERELQTRRKDYEALGVRDVWILGHTRTHRTEPERDSLAASLAKASNQRTLYVFWPENACGPHLEESILAAPAEDDSLKDVWPTRWPAEPGTPGYLPALESVAYSARLLRLSAAGTLFTPADRIYEKRRAELEREQKARELRRSAEARRRQEAESRARWAEERRAEESRSWRKSTLRQKSIERLGSSLVEKLEREDKLDKNIYTAPGRWKLVFFLENIHGRPPDTSFDYFAAGWKILDHFGYNMRGKDWAWRALHTFRDRLQREGYIEFDSNDSRGAPRFWRACPDGSGRATRQTDGGKPLVTAVREHDDHDSNERKSSQREGKFYSAQELRERIERNQGK